MYLIPIFSIFKHKMETNPKCDFEDHCTVNSFTNWILKYLNDKNQNDRLIRAINNIDEKITAYEYIEISICVLLDVLPKDNFSLSWLNLRLQQYEKDPEFKLHISTTYKRFLYLRKPYYDLYKLKGLPTKSY